MSGWSLRWKEQPAGPAALIDGSGLRPDLLASLREGDVRAAKIRAGRRERRLDELFDVERLDGGGAELTLEVDGSPRWERLGAATAGGVLVVRGDGGAWAGARMTGGELRVRGSAGDSCGAGMLGGLIRVDGGAGEELGGPCDGDAAGMRGGEIVVAGDAGDDAGLCARRGLIAIGGRAHGHVGRHLRAGTILVAQGELDAPGLEMRRGSIIALGGPPRLSIGFERDGLAAPTWLRVLAKRLRALRFDAAAGLEARLEAGEAFESWSGDVLSLGKGEVIFPAAT